MLTHALEHLHHTKAPNTSSGQVGPCRLVLNRSSQPHQAGSWTQACPTRTPVLYPSPPTCIASAACCSMCLISASSPSRSRSSAAAGRQGQGKGRREVRVRHSTNDALPASSPCSDAHLQLQQRAGSRATWQWQIGWAWVKAAGTRCPRMRLIWVQTDQVQQAVSHAPRAPTRGPRVVQRLKALLQKDLAPCNRRGRGSG